MWGVGEVASQASALSSRGVGLAWAADGLVVSGAYQSFNDANKRSLDGTTLGAAYQWGSVRLAANAGRNKAETVAKYGEEQVRIWRRSYDVAPPGGESLKMTRERTVPFFERAVLGDIRQGQDVLLVAHGNSNRSIVMALENLTPEQVLELELATGIPRVYELSTSGEVLGIETLS